MFAPWEPPKSYVNRYSWRGSKAYQDLVRGPAERALIPALPKGTLQDAVRRDPGPGRWGHRDPGGKFRTTQGSRESMVRNVDGMVFGKHRARAAIDLPTSLDLARRAGDGEARARG